MRQFIKEMGLQLWGATLTSSPAPSPMKYSLTTFTEAATMTLKQFTEQSLKEFDENFPDFQASIKQMYQPRYEIEDTQIKSFLTIQLRLLAEGMKEIVPPESLESHPNFADYPVEAMEGWSAARTELLTRYNEFMK